MISPMEIILRYEEYEQLTTVAAQLPDLLKRVGELASQLDALRCQYTECLERLADLQRSL